MKQYLIAFLLLLPANPSWAFEVKFDGGRIVIDEEKAFRFNKANTDVVSESKIYPDGENFSIDSTIIAKCDRNQIKLSQIRYSDLRGYSFYEDMRWKTIDVTPGSAYAQVLKRMCSLKNIELVQ